jgi:hypothetical protein
VLGTTVTKYCLKALSNFSSLTQFKYEERLKGLSPLIRKTRAKPAPLLKSSNEINHLSQAN